jgi:hypothetical protein
MVRCVVKREPKVIVDPSSRIRGRDAAWIVCAAVGSSYSVDGDEFCDFMGWVCGWQEVPDSQWPDQVSSCSAATVGLWVEEDWAGGGGAGRGELYAPSDVCCTNDGTGMGMEILTMDVFEIVCELGRIGEGRGKAGIGRLVRFESLSFIFGFWSSFCCIEVTVLVRWFEP